MATKKKPSTAEQPAHTSQTPFGALLSQFVGSGIDDFSSMRSQSVSISPALLDTMQRDRAKSSRKKSGGSFGDLDLGLDDKPIADLDDIDELMPDEDYDDTFDRLIESAFMEDEDVTLRNNLTAMGRKYAIRGLEEDQETSEVNRAFVRQEQKLDMLLEEIDTGAQMLDKDIEMMRMSRTKNYKAMADLISARVSMYGSKLQAIKEQSSIAKAKIDLAAKLRKESNAESADNGFMATQAVQKLLSVGRANLVNDDDDDIPFSTPVESGDAMDDETSRRLRLARDIPPPTSDGDRFIQHENEGVEYVVDIDSETDRRQIYAIDKHGSVVPDYPLPSNPEQLNFQINELAGEATDQLQRRYLVRRDGQDIIERSYADSSDGVSY